ncbi:hypothetical protein NMG60_11033887 [Bertholletia excelsa]
MDSSTAQHQEMGSQTLESVLSGPKAQQENKKPRPQPEQALKCPRCDSTNTKFCYYNNYSLSQPRYFCKSCRRYWTKGGTLRNVPVGGGCRKNKRSSSSKRIASQDHGLSSTPSTPHLPPLTYDSTDLSLAFARLQSQKHPNGQFGNFDDLSMFAGDPNAESAPATPHNSFLQALKGGFCEAPISSFQNLYYGSMGLAENVSQELAMPYEDLGGAATSAVTVTTVKQEGENRGVFWGLPWQIGGGDGNVGGGEVDVGRESWINGMGMGMGMGNVNVSWGCSFNAVSMPSQQGKPLLFLTYWIASTGMTNLPLTSK